MKADEFELLNNGGEDGLASFYSDEEDEASSKATTRQKNSVKSSGIEPSLKPHQETGDELPPPVTQSIRYQPQSKIMQVLNPIIALLALWFTSIASILITKTLFTEESIQFPNPIFLTWLQQVLVFMILFGLGEMGKTRPSLGLSIPPFDFDIELVKKMVPLSCIYLSMMLLGNMCLFNSEAIYYQVASSLSVIFTLLLEKIMLNKTATPGFLATGLIIAVGFVMASSGNKVLNLLGVVSGVAFGFSSALNHIYTKKTLAQINNEWVILSYNAAISIVVTLPLILVSGELVRAAYTSTITVPSFWITTFILGILILLNQVATMHQPVSVSSPIVAISSITKETLQAILVAVFFKNKISAINGFGIAMIIVGLGSFAYLRHSENRIR